MPQHNEQKPLQRLRTRVYKELTEEGQAIWKNGYDLGWMRGVLLGFAICLLFLLIVAFGVDYAREWLHP